MSQALDWNVAVYCANEASRLGRCLESVTRALAGHRALVTVIVNGSSDRSLAIALERAASAQSIEVAQIVHADKANAINQFIHRLRSPARFYGGVDGYAIVGRDAFTAMTERLESDPHAVAVTGVASSGRSMRDVTAATLARGGRLHGQLHGFRAAFLDRMVAQGIRLPVGLYRGDGLLGSMAAHDLDAAGEPWINARIAGVAAATFDVPRLSPFSVSDVRRRLVRRVRQMRGTIENEAIKAIIYRGGYQSLPVDADRMIRDYVEVHGVPPVGPADRVFQYFAVRAARKAGAVAPQSLEARRLGGGAPPGV